ncbi:MAG: PaaI family thioesterase [Pseudomonadota bacterium]
MSIPDLSKMPDISKMTGLQQFEAVREGLLPPPSIGKTLNFSLSHLAYGEVHFAGTPTDAFLNPMLTVHGGWTMTLLDSCVACAVHSTLEAGEVYTTLELKTNFVRTIRPNSGVYTAKGKIVHRGGRTATAEGRLEGEDGKLYAHASTTCIIMRPEISG